MFVEQWDPHRVPVFAYENDAAFDKLGGIDELSAIPSTSRMPGEALTLLSFHLFCWRTVRLGKIQGFSGLNCDVASLKISVQSSGGSFISENMAAAAPLLDEKD